MAVLTPGLRPLAAPLASAEPRNAFPGPDFRALMTEFPTGVGVVTSTERDGTPRGMTCSSICSVTLTPPTLLVCLRSSSPTLAVVLERSRFTVNLVHQDARDTAELFASGRPGRFDLVDWELPEHAGGPHLVAAAHAIADCVVSRTELIGDHVVVFGETYAVTLRGERGPLLYGRREYRSWDTAPAGARRPS